MSLTAQQPQLRPNRNQGQNQDAIKIAGIHLKGSRPLSNNLSQIFGVGQPSRIALTVANYLPTSSATPSSRARSLNSPISATVKSSPPASSDALRALNSI